MDEHDWKDAFIRQMQLLGAGKVAVEEANFQWATAPNVESIDPEQWANKVASAYL